MGRRHEAIVAAVLLRACGHVRGLAEHGDVTVVIPCFNYGRFLPGGNRQRVRAGGGAARTIVVDDGSNDRTLEVLDDLPEAVALRLRNGGLAAAQRRVRASDTALVLALDADDMLPPRALQALKEGLALDPAAGFAYGITRVFGDWSGNVGAQ